MTHQRINILAWIMTTVALIVWCLIGFAAWKILTDSASHTSDIQSAQQQSNKDADALHVHAIAASTANARQQLLGLFNADPVTIGNTIVAAGKSAGVDVKINGVTKDGSLAETSLGSVNILAFTIETYGSFSQVMQTVVQLENLPIPATVDQLDISHTPSTDTSAPGAWHMNASVRVFTTSQTSS